MASLQGQTAIVTGGGAGIGRAIALEAARQGAAVAALDINEAGARETADMIVKAGGKALGLVCDVSKPADLAPLVERVAGELGAPSLLFNVAAIVKYAHIEDTDIELFNRILSINLTGAFAMTKAVLPHLTAKKGSILNVASMAGTLGTIQATEAVKYLLGAGELLENRLLVYDSLRMRMRTVNVKRDPRWAPGAAHPDISDLAPLGEEPLCELKKNESPMRRPGDLKP